MEVEVFEEDWDAGEETDAFDAALLGFMKEGLDEQAACSVPCRVWADDDGAYLCEVGTVDVERGTADELVCFVFDDDEGADVCADLGVGAGKKRAIVGEAIDELMDGLGVLQLCYARSKRQERRFWRFVYEVHCHMPLRFLCRV